MIDWKKKIIISKRYKRKILEEGKENIVVVIAAVKKMERKNEETKVGWKLKNGKGKPEIFFKKRSVSWTVYFVTWTINILNFVTFM